MSARVTASIFPSAETAILLSPGASILRSSSFLKPESVQWPETMCPGPILDDHFTGSRYPQ